MGEKKYRPSQPLAKKGVESRRIDEIAITPIDDGVDAMPHSSDEMEAGHRVVGSATTPHYDGGRVMPKPPAE